MIRGTSSRPRERAPRSEPAIRRGAGAWGGTWTSGKTLETGAWAAPGHCQAKLTTPRYVQIVDAPFHQAVTALSRWSPPLTGRPLRSFRHRLCRRWYHFSPGLSQGGGLCSRGGHIRRRARPLAPGSFELLQSLHQRRTGRRAARLPRDVRGKLGFRSVVRGMTVRGMTVKLMAAHIFFLKCNVGARRSFSRRTPFAFHFFLLTGERGPLWAHPRVHGSTRRRHHFPPLGHAQPCSEPQLA